MLENQSVVAKAKKWGFDLSLIDCSLSYSYQKRAEQHQSALNLAVELEKIGRQLRDGLNRILRRLCDAKIDFVIVGGFAAMLHGSPLRARDLDVCVIDGRNR